MKKIIATLAILSVLIMSLISCNTNSNPPTNDSVYFACDTDHDAVVARILKGEIEVAVLPEPKATAAITQAKAQGLDYSIKLNLSEVWSELSNNDLAMGCIVANNAFIQSNESALVGFLSEYRASIEYIGNPENAEAAAQMIVNAGILPKLPIAKSALKNLEGSIIYRDGAEMKATLNNFYDAINLAKPADSFFYSPVSSATGTSSEKIAIGVMNGPTGMGMAKMMADYGLENEKYEFKLYSDPTLATADLNSGTLDLVCLPTNTAATLSNKGASISVAAINCLGSLYVVAKSDVQITELADLANKTLYFGVPNSTTAPILRYLFGKIDLEIKES